MKATLKINATNIGYHDSPLDEKAHMFLSDDDGNQIIIETQREVAVRLGANIIGYTQTGEEYNGQNPMRKDDEQE